MSLETCKARLEAATPTGIGVLLSHHQGPVTELFTHAPTDLRLALDVIEAAMKFRNASMVSINPMDQRIALSEALNAFEAAP